MGFLKKISPNVFSLFVLQIANYAIPLISIPYLTRVLELESFGILSFTQSLIQYFANLTDFGFNYLGARKIALSRENKLEVQRIFTSIFYSKSFLATISLVILLILIFIFPQIRENKLTILISYSAVIGNCIFPVWFFQGLEEMKYISWLTISTRGSLTLSTFFLVKNKADLWLAVFLQTSWPLFAGIASIIIIKHKFNVRLISKPNFAEMLKEIKEGSKIYLANLANNIYSHGSIIILGFFKGYTETGYFSLAQRFSYALTSLAQPIAQGTYPYISREYEKNPNSFFKIRKKIISIGVFIGLIIGFIIILFNDKIIFLLTGSEPQPLRELLTPFSFVFFVIFLNVLITPFILAMHRINEMKGLYLSAALIFIALSAPISIYLNSFWMVILLLLIETIILCGSIIITRNPNGKKNFSIN